MKISTEQGSTHLASEAPTWLPGLLASVGVDENSNLDEVYRRTDAAANQSGPATRRMWWWIIMLEGTAVLVPLLWLLVLRLRWSAGDVAVAVLACSVALVGVCWWLRWRGMQHTWTRARLVAELARSAQATNWLPGRITVGALSYSPRFQAIAAKLPDSGASASDLNLATVQHRYIKERIDDQLNHFTKKRSTTIVERARLTGLVTWSLDGALFFSVAGLVIAMSDAAGRWLRLSGADYLLAIAGAALPLTAILMQSLGAFLEFGRRTGRYAQQIEMLQAARKRLGESEDLETALSLVQEIEQALLSEVIEWFYQLENAELYYRPRNRTDEPDPAPRQTFLENRTWVGRGQAVVGSGARFIGRVIVGRVLVAALSMVLTAALIANFAPRDTEERSLLRGEDGRLRSSATARSWDPVPERTERGFVLVAHGLHDGVFEKAGRDEWHWMFRMQQALEKKLDAKCPEICLVDWHLAAMPGKFGITGWTNPIPLIGDRHDKEFSSVEWLQDIPAIRATATEIGELVGFKLAQAIHDGRIRKDRPMHFIGHSAGGFVVLTAAKVLHSLGDRIAPENLRLTILDTPLPVEIDLRSVAQWAAIDFYQTSDFAVSAPADGFVPNFHRIDVPVPPEEGRFLKAHSYAHSWFIKSIESNDPKGFGRSPFAPKQ